MQQFIHVNAGKKTKLPELQILSVSSISLDLIKSACEAHKEVIEAATARFRYDRSLIIYVNGLGQVKKMPIYCKLRSTGEVFFGPIFICASEGESEAGLSARQIQIVKQELQLVGSETPPAPRAFASPASLFSDHMSLPY